MFTRRAYNPGKAIPSAPSQEVAYVPSITEDDFSSVDLVKSKFAIMQEEMRQNAIKNKQRREHQDRLENMLPVHTRPKTATKPSKFIIQQVKKYQQEEKKFKKSGGLGKQPQFNYNVNAGEWHESLVEREDKEILDRIFGNQVSTQDYLPQQLVVERPRAVNLPRLLVIAFSEASLAVQKGILLEKKIVTSAGPVGIHYLVMCTILYDLIKALNNEWTLFQEVTPFYNYVRSFLLPKVIDKYSYSWTGVPDMGSLLASASIPFALDEPGPNHVSLAWLLGTYNQYGQAELANTLPIMQINDLETVGVQAVAEIWKRVLQQSEGSTHLIEPFIHDRANSSPAAFAIPADLGVPEYNGYLTIMSEMPIRGHCYFMSALMLVDPAAVDVVGARGKFVYTTYAGAAAYNWRLLNQDVSVRKFNPRPRQVPLSMFFTQVLTMIAQADIIAHDLDPVGLMTQPSGSYIGRLNAGDFIMAVTSFILKRYAMNNFIMLGSDSVNEGTHKLGVGTEFIIDYGSVINGVLPTLTTEGLASLVLKTIKTGDGFNGAGEYDLMIPYVIMTGSKTNADPLNNHDVADPLSISELLLSMYPDLDATIVYQLGNANPYQTFDIAQSSTSFLYGDAVNDAITKFNVLVESLQGYYDIGLSVGNVHEEPYTLADYTYLCSPFDSSIAWDDSATTRISGLSSVIAFDPDRVSDQLTRILPVVFGDDFQSYISMTNETTSLQLSIELPKQIITSAVANVHPIAGIGNETSIADRAITARGEGGGVMDFFKSVGKAALPAVSLMLGNVADAYAPGTGAIVRSVGDTVTGLLGAHRETPFVRGLIKKGHKNPYARIFRPITEHCHTRSPFTHVTPRHKYY